MIQPGPSALRRLTRDEYDATIRDLLGDDSRPASLVPARRGRARLRGRRHRLAPPRRALACGPPRTSPRGPCASGSTRSCPAIPARSVRRSARAPSSRASAGAPTGARSRPGSWSASWRSTARAPPRAASRTEPAW
ncbi:MAG: DUF1587 domain-containing protein [Sandaracinaceae bacterium]|nr:DUF1587 domain-containing protein [Sandaracinaceae bacterium]